MYFFIWMYSRMVPLQQGEALGVQDVGVVVIANAVLKMSCLMLTD